MILQFTYSADDIGPIRPEGSLQEIALVLARHDASREGIQPTRVVTRPDMLRGGGLAWTVTIEGRPDGGPFDHSGMD